MSTATEKNGHAAVSFMLHEARNALAHGISVVPPAEDGTKRPLGTWDRFMRSLPTDGQLERWYGDRTGMGFVCGPISGGLECFEFDDAEVYARFKAAAKVVDLADLVNRIEAGYCETTPGHGVHWLYRTPEARGNTKLAQRPDPTEANPHGRKVLIETRGEGGYVVVAPTFGAVHPTGNPYRLVSGGVDSIAVLTAEERNLLWALARSFDEIPEPVATPERANGRQRRQDGKGTPPGTDFNHRATWDEVLVGWVNVYTRGEVTYWRRPGKDRGWSATTGSCKAEDGTPRLKVFSTSTPFDANRTYDLFSAHAHLNHGGDLSLAAKALAESGYGTYIGCDGVERPNPRPRKAPPRPAPSSNGKHRSPTPAAETGGDSQFPTFANFEAVRITSGEQTKEVKIAWNLGQIDDGLDRLAPGWPKRVGHDCTLFVEGPGHRPVYLDNTARLFAWVGRWAQVDWAKGGRFIPQERYYEHRRMNSEHVDAIETIPHWPRMPGIFYMHPPVGRGDGRHLDRFIDFFRPYTPEDRILIRAFVLTCFWGGPLGGRPAFLVTGPDVDEQQGRGVGKTRLVDLIAELAGGSIDVAPTDQIGDVKTRLLSDTARQTRMARLDNVKTLKFSWADLENIITGTEISGKMLYKGEGRRPNTLIWTITLNGATLSKDLAVRVIPIKLARPVYVAGWEDEVRSYIASHRDAILADVRALLESEPERVEARTRWATWERDVLARCGMVEPCQGVIVERQNGADDDAEERDVVEEFIRHSIEVRRHDPDRSIVFLPTRLAAKLVNVATNQKLPTNKASAHLATLGIRTLRKSAHNGARGWEWRGAKASPGLTRIVLGAGDGSDGTSDGSSDGW